MRLKKRTYKNYKYCQVLNEFSDKYLAKKPKLNVIFKTGSYTIGYVDCNDTLHDVYVFNDNTVEAIHKRIYSKSVESTIINEILRHL